jgi:hypothetical protein
MVLRKDVQVLEVIRLPEDFQDGRPAQLVI